MAGQTKETMKMAAQMQKNTDKCLKGMGQMQMSPMVKPEKKNK